MLSEIQKIIDKMNKQGKEVQLILNHELRDLEIRLNILYIAYDTGWISIHSELAIVKLKVDFIASIGQVITLSAEESFVANIIFPEPYQEELACIIDYTIKRLNKVISIDRR